MYRIYNKEMDAFFTQGIYCKKEYEQMKQSILNPNSTYYGAKLVILKRIKIGFSIKVKILYRNHFYWKPHFSFKYSKFFHWLFFMIWFENEFDEVKDYVLKDYLRDKLHLVDDNGNVVH